MEEPTVTTVPKRRCRCASFCRSVNEDERSPLLGSLHRDISEESSSSITGNHCHAKKKEAGGVDKKARRQLLLASMLCLLFMVGEIVGGILANSLAIATDAAHLLTDFASFMISLLSIYIASRPATKRMSFGWYRAEVMGACVSVLLIWVVTGILVYMAVERVISGDYEIDATVMLITAGVGVAINIIMGMTLHNHAHGHSHGGQGHGHSHGGQSQGHGHSHEGQRSSTAEANHHTSATPGECGGITSQTNNAHTYGAVDQTNSAASIPVNGEVGQGQGQVQGQSEGQGQSQGQGQLQGEGQVQGESVVGRTRTISRTISITDVREVGHLDVSSSSLPSVHIQLEDDNICEGPEKKPDAKHQENINVRAAFIHVLGDLLQSVGILIAAFIIYYKPEWKIADPICTFIFSILVLITTITILRDTLNVLMEGAPRGISFNEVKESLCSIQGVKELHNLRLWSLTMNKTAVSVHLALDQGGNAQYVLAEAGRIMTERYGVYECTVQIENYVDEMDGCTHCQDPRD